VDPGDGSRGREDAHGEGRLRLAGGGARVAEHVDVGAHLADHQIGLQAQLTLVPDVGDGRNCRTG
jgi:hypothetical protein